MCRAALLQFKSRRLTAIAGFLTAEKSNIDGINVVAKRALSIYYIIVLLDIKWSMSERLQQPDIFEVMLPMVSQLQIHRSLLSSSMGTTTNTNTTPDRSDCSAQAVCISESPPLHERIKLRRRRNGRHRPTCGRPPVGNSRDLLQAQHRAIDR